MFVALVSSAGTLAAKAAPQVAPLVKELAPVAARNVVKSGIYAIVLNEIGRLHINRQNRKVEPEVIEGTEVKVADNGGVILADQPKRPFWKKALDIREGETVEQNVARRSRVLWDIVCYGLGNELFVANFFTVKLAKAALWLLGAALTAVAFPVTALGLAICIPFGMSSARYAELLHITSNWLMDVLFIPFRAMRRVDHFFQDLSWRLMTNRSTRYMDRKYRMVDKDGKQSTVTTHEVPVEPTEPVQAEVKIEPVPVTEVTIDEVKVEGDGKLAEVHDIKHHFITVTIDVAEIRKDPREFGKKLFAEEYAQSNLVEANNYRTATLPDQLRKAGVNGRNAALVLQGFDEAAKAAAPGTTATS